MMAWVQPGNSVGRIDGDGTRERTTSRMNDRRERESGRAAERVRGPREARGKERGGSGEVVREHGAGREAQRKDASGYEAEELLTALVEQLTAVHADPAYRTVWECSQLHLGPYRGPT